MKKLIFCFDGTCNNPKDVGDYFDDISISNILKIHIFLGGKLNNQNTKNHKTPNQQSFYYSGIGNRGNWLIRAINAAFAPSYGEMNDILSEANDDLSQHYTEGDEVYIFGFSRGAAIARMFAAHLTVPVRFLGVFDTVAATKGSLDLNPNTFPSSGIVFENDKLAPHIDRALHLLALDEERVWLQPTLFNHDKRVKEVWFAGSHSDIGGGYWYDGLSDICLQFMLKNIASDLTILTANEIDYLALTTPDSTEMITIDDLNIKPLITGKLHNQQYYNVKTFIHTTRSVRINVDELPSPYLPLVHCSVEERFQQLETYRPQALSDLRFYLVDGLTGISEEKQGDFILAST